MEDSDICDRLVEIIVARPLVVIDHCWLNQNVLNTAWVPVMAEQTASAIARNGMRYNHPLLGFDHNSYAASCLFPASRSPHAYVTLFWWSNSRCPHEAIDFSKELSTTFTIGPHFPLLYFINRVLLPTLVSLCMYTSLSTLSRNYDPL